MAALEKAQVDNTTEQRYLPWVLLFVVMAVAFIGWSEGLNWKFSRLNGFLLFPLLGLWAWSIMWTHYILGARSAVWPNYRKNQLYKRISGYIVLALILLHPGLLAYAQWQNGKGLPPASELSYVAKDLRIYVVLGFIALFTFLSYELFERMRSKLWVSRNWRWISLSQMIAMGLIFIHSLELGRNLQSGWMQFYWIVLGALLIPAFGLVGRIDWSKSRLPR